MKQFKNIINDVIAVPDFLWPDPKIPTTVTWTEVVTADTTSQWRPNFTLVITPPDILVNRTLFPPFEPDDNMGFSVAYAMFLTAGSLANITLCCFLLALRRLRNAQNLFVVNVCMANVLLGCSGVVAFIDVVSPVWILSAEACRFFGFLALAPAVAVVLSMVAISWNRHRVVTSKTVVRSFFSRKVALIILGVVWTTALLICTPILFGWITLKSGLFCACCFYFNENVEYGLTLSICVYILPNILTVFYYIRILIHVRRSRRRVAQHQACTSSNQVIAHAQRNEIRVAVQFITLFLVFNACYLPPMILFWLQTAENKASLPLRSSIIFIFAINLLLNPFVYFIFNRQARQACRNLFREACVKIRPCVKASHVTSETLSRESPSNDTSPPRDDGSDHGAGADAGAGVASTETIARACRVGTATNDTACCLHEATSSPDVANDVITSVEAQHL